MRRLLIVALALTILIPALRMTDYSTGYAQSTPGIGIGTSTPHASAILDISFADKGVLFPRLTTAQRNAISAPAAGLLIYTQVNLETGVANLPGKRVSRGTRWGHRLIR